MRGLDEARRLYEEYGAPMLRERFPQLLPHLAAKQMGKKVSEAVEGENLNVLVGSRPLRPFHHPLRPADGSQGLRPPLTFAHRLTSTTGPPPRPTIAGREQGRSI